MKKHVKEFVQSCVTCQQAKPDRVKYPGLLLSLPVPTHAWHTVSLDFITELPQTNRYSCILVVVDKFSKYAHLANKSACSFSPLGIFFTEKSLERSFQSSDCIQISFKLRISCLATLIHVARNNLRISFKDCPSYSHCL
jgi:hypothetical protein